MKARLQMFVFVVIGPATCTYQKNRRLRPFESVTTQDVFSHSQAAQEYGIILPSLAFRRRPRVRQGRLSRRGCPFTMIRLRTMKVGSELYCTGSLLGRVICSSRTWQHFPKMTSKLSESCCCFHEPSPDGHRLVHRAPLSHSSIQPLGVIPSCIQAHNLLPPKCHAKLLSNLRADC